MAIVLRKGDKGKVVREIQGLLNSKSGKVVLKTDGDFGGKTEIAVKDFQEKMKLKMDGVVGSKTWDALHNQALRAQFNNYVAAHDWFSLADLEKFFADLGKHTEESPNSIEGSTLKPKNSSASISNKVIQVAHNNAKIVVPSIVKATDFKSFKRISFDKYEGRGYIIKDFEKFENGAIQLLPDKKIFANVSQSELKNLKNECAQFVQYFGVPSTGNWLRGPRVCDFKFGELPKGTVVATLRDGKYYNDYSGRSHVGIYLSHDDYTNYLLTKNKSAGVTLMDQWKHVPIGRRSKKYSAEGDVEGSLTKKSWTDPKGIIHNRRVKWGEDGEEYYVLLTKL